VSELRFIPPGIYKSQDPDGATRYVVPGSPFKTGETRGMFDVVEQVGRWMDRSPGSTGVQTADSLFLMQYNCRRNRALGKMRDWRDLWGKEAEKICLFISCGPSLTESLPEIKELAADKEKYFTLGLNRAFKAMDLDYFVAVDRRAQNDWIDRDVKDTTLIAATTAQPAIVEKFKDRYFGESFLAGVDEGNAPLRTGLATTMCDAMHAAYKLGAEEIWIYGADFAISGSAGPQVYQLDKYYFDMPSYVGLGIRPEEIRNMQPVKGINGSLCFINLELHAYACYATAMACMIEESGMVPVRNKSKAGIMYWGVDE
jgi:hypothetical protein